MNERCRLCVLNKRPVPNIGLLPGNIYEISSKTGFFFCRNVLSHGDRTSFGGGIKMTSTEIIF